MHGTWSPGSPTNSIGMKAAASRYLNDYAVSSHAQIRCTGIAFIKLANKTVSIADLPGYCPAR